MFSSVVVAADFDADRVRAIPVGAALAGRGQLPVQVLTVASQNGGSDDLARRRRLSAHGLSDSLCVLPHDDVATAIVDHVHHRQGALLVMATNANSLVSQRLHGSVSVRVLHELRQPVLLVGPAVTDPVPLASPTLVACTDRSQDSVAALPVIESWQRTFGGGRPWVVEVMPTVAWPEGTIDDDVEREHVDALGAVLADHGIDVATRVLHGGDPVQWLLEFAEHVDDAVFVATSARWAGSRSHWYSTTRRLVQRSPRPVLVVPADLPGY
ncbi:MAG: universal stress protein [Ilumatobacteraceae bacterium]